MNRCVLITGGGGFMGRYALPHFLELGYEVHVVALAPFPKMDRITWHNVNLLDPKAAFQLVNTIKPALCLHLAWDVSDGFWSAPSNLTWTAASLVLLRAFVESGGRRFVGVGSCSEYDWSLATRPLRESTACRPSTLYGVSKDALHRILQSYAEQAGISYAWARLFFAYGPYERPNRLVPTIIRNLYEGKPVPMTSGQQHRDFMDNRDVGHALAALTLSDVNGAVNVGTGEAPSVLKIARTLEELMDRQDLLRPGSLPARDNDPPLLQADITRLKNEVKFTPSYSLERGLAETVAWWRNYLKPEEKAS